MDRKTEFLNFWVKMNITNIKKHLDWEQYYNPNFDWDNPYFYFNKKLFTQRFLWEFKNKINWNFLFLSGNKVSENFIEKIEDDIKDWTWLYAIEYISSGLFQKFKHKLGL